MLGTIHAVRGAILPNQLGFCHVHEHIWTDKTPASVIEPKLEISDIQKSTLELKQFFRSGGRAIVDAQPVGAGRSIEKLFQLSCNSNVNIIASTGFHRPKFYQRNHWLFNSSVNELTNLFSHEIRNGCYLDGNHSFPKQKSNHCAGIIKSAIGANFPDLICNNAFIACVYSSIETGAALMIHVESAGAALGAVDFAVKCGLDAHRIVISHIDKFNNEYSTIKEIASSGVSFEFDTIERPKIHDNNDEIELIKRVISDNYLSQLMLSLDSTSERLSEYGGKVGLDYIINRFVPELIMSGIDLSEIEQMMVNNPQEILSIR